MYLNTEFGPNTGKDGPEKLIIHKFRILKVSEASDHEDSNLLWTQFLTLWSDVVPK